MPGTARRVQISERQQSVLLEFSRSRTEAKALSQRAQIILAAFDGRLNENNAREVGLNRKHVGRWRRRWQDAGEELTRLECMEPSKPKAAIRETLADAPRSGSPGSLPQRRCVAFWRWIHRLRPAAIVICHRAGSSDK